MTTSLPQAAAAALLLALPITLFSQVPDTPAPRSYTPFVNRNLILLDPAHGGTDDGAHIGEHVLEKDITLALATRIRTLLAPEGLTLLTTREADATSSPLDPQTPAQSSDTRAGIANHAHPTACILLHATGSGRGVHIITSDLDPLDPSELATLTPSRPVPWETAQAASVLQSLRLANDLATSVARAGLPVHLSHASVRPINSLTCPAVAVEIAPLGSATTTVSDPVYQQRVAQAVANALLFWRTNADPNAPTATPTPSRPKATPSPASPAGTPPTAPKPRPRPVSPAPADSTPNPAPIIRRPPPTSPASSPGALR